MELLAHIGAAAMVVATVVVGVVAHEFSHLAVLRLAGVTCTVEVLPKSGDDGAFSVGMGNPLARVRPTSVPDDVSPWSIRAAALTPLLLSVPLVLVLLGAVPDPFASGSLPTQLALVMWVGCSIPSPQDFSVAWYPRRALAIAAGGQKAADGRHSLIGR